MSSDKSGSERCRLPKTSPEYPENITDPVCVGCGKSTGDVCVCYGCRGRIRGASPQDIETELIKAFTRGRATEYWSDRNE